VAPKPQNPKTPFIDLVVDPTQNFKILLFWKWRYTLNPEKSGQ